MRRRIAFWTVLLALGLGACENTATTPDRMRSGASATAGFDGVGGTLGSGYGVRQTDTTNYSTTMADTMGRVGGTLGSGY